jgi:hypothetical protein
LYEGRLRGYRAGRVDLDLRNGAGRQDGKYIRFDKCFAEMLRTSLLKQGRTLTYLFRRSRPVDRISFRWFSI